MFTGDLKTERLECFYKHSLLGVHDRGEKKEFQKGNRELHLVALCLTTGNVRNRFLAVLSVASRNLSQSMRWHQHLTSGRRLPLNQKETVMGTEAAITATESRARPHGPANLWLACHMQQ